MKNDLQLESGAAVTDIPGAGAAPGPLTWSLTDRTRMMTRMLPTSPLLLGFEDLERLIDRTGKSGSDGYPPYNIERINRADGTETLRITLAVAGFARDDLEISLEDKQLTIRGKQADDAPRDYIHRGIAARQFSRTFVLADGLEVKGADLSNGLLAIDLVKLQPAKLVRTINIAQNER